MFAVCPAWHWKPGLAYWALQKRRMSCLKTSKSPLGSRREFLCASGLSVHGSLCNPGPSPACLYSTVESLFIFKPKRHLVHKHCTNVCYLSIGLSSVKVQEVHFIDSGNCSVRLLMQTGSFFSCQVVLRETWFQRGEQAEALGRSCPKSKIKC